MTANVHFYSIKTGYLNVNLPDRKTSVRYEKKVRIKEEARNEFTGRKIRA